MKHGHGYGKCEWIFSIIFIKICFSLCLYDKRETGHPWSPDGWVLTELDSASTWVKVLKSVKRLLPCSSSPAASHSTLCCQCAQCQPLWTENRLENPQSVSGLCQGSRDYWQQDKAVVWKLKAVKALGKNKNAFKSSYLEKELYRENESGRRGLLRLTTTQDPKCWLPGFGEGVGVDFQKEPEDTGLFFVPWEAFGCPPCRGDRVSSGREWVPERGCTQEETELYGCTA